MSKVTTFFTTKYDDLESVMTGEEIFPIIGNLVTEEQASEVIKQFRGLNPYWNCLEKTRIADKYFYGIPTIGSLHILNVDFKSAYGYEFNPPFEFHTWLTILGTPIGIIDIALPGAIQKGLTTYDEIGPALVGREPIILAGEIPDWLIYQHYEIL